MTRTLPDRAPPALPYASDAEYLDHALNWVRLRIARISAELKAATAAQDEDEHDGDRLDLHRPGRTGSREARLRSVELKEKEQRHGAEVHARVQAHRADLGRRPLGLDAVCADAALSEDERLILLTVLAAEIAPKLAEKVLGGLELYLGSLSVADAATVLNPQGVAGWLAARSLFQPDAPLVRRELIVLSPPGGPQGPGSLMASDVSLSPECFAMIVGDQSRAEIAAERSAELP